MDGESATFLYWMLGIAATSHVGKNMDGAIAATPMILTAATPMMGEGNRDKHM